MRKIVILALSMCAAIAGAQVQIAKGVQIGNASGGLTSINDQTGPHITLQSSDASVLITIPEENVFDFSVAPSQILANAITVPLSGQFYILYPSSYTLITDGTGDGASLADTKSASIAQGPDFSSTWGVTYHYTLPAGISAGAVTTIYASAQTMTTFNAGTYDGNTFQQIANGSCTNGGVDTYALLPGSVASLGTHHPWGLTQVNTLASGWAGSDIDSVTCTFTLTGSAPFIFGASSGMSVVAPVLMFNYTGTPVTQPASLLVAAPLTIVNGTLQLTIPYDSGPESGLADAYVVTIPGFNALTANVSFKFTPLNSNTLTNPTVNMNGLGAVTIKKAGGAALSVGDVVANVGAIVNYVNGGGANNYFELENPQTGGGGSSGITALTGDVTATGPGSAAASVVKVNGGSVPTSKAFTGTDSSGRIVDASTTYGSASQFGIVKVDGTTVTATGGVLSATGGGGAVSSVSNSDSSLTISPTTGAVVASLNVAHSNAWTATQTNTVSWAATDGSNSTYLVPSGWYNAQSGHGSVYSKQTGTNQMTDSNDSASTTPVVQRVFGEALLKERATIDGASGFGGIGFSSSDHQPYVVQNGGPADEVCTVGNAACGGGGSGTVSGQAAGVVGLATGSSTTGAQSHIDENTSGQTTVSQKFAVIDTADPSLLLLYPTAHACAAVTGSFGVCPSDSLSAASVLQGPDTPPSGDNIWYTTTTSSVMKMKPVVIGANMTFSAGVLAATAGGGGNYINLCSIVAFTNASCSGTQIIPNSSVSTFTISSIPGTYNTIILTCDERGTDGAAFVDDAITINGDTGSHYDYMGIQGNGSSATADPHGFGVTAMQLFDIPAGGSTADVSGGGTLSIANYAGATFNKHGQWTNGLNESASQGGTYIYRGDFWWKPSSPAAITSITRTLSAGNYATGTTCTLYGTN